MNTLTLKIQASNLSPFSIFFLLYTKVLKFDGTKMVLPIFFHIFLPILGPRS